VANEIRSRQWRRLSEPERITEMLECGLHRGLEAIGTTAFLRWLLLLVFPHIITCETPYGAVVAGPSVQ
jgi:hypothetical protein